MAYRLLRVWLMSSRVVGPATPVSGSPKKPDTASFKQALLTDPRKRAGPDARAAARAAASPSTPGTRADPFTSSRIGPTTSVGTSAGVSSAGPNALQLARTQHSAIAQQASVVRAHHDATAAQAQVTRAHHAQTVEQAAMVRTEGLDHGEQKLNGRVVDLIVKELVAEFETRPGQGGPSKVANPVQPMSSDVPFPTGPAATPQVQTAETRAAQAVQLIERIDTFVRSGRPALALTLNNSLGARVEIEKLGPGRIALRLVGQNGPPSPDTVSRIRDELLARGLQVGALSVA